MKCIFPLLISLLLLLTGCGGNAADGSYQQIIQEEAKEMKMCIRDRGLGNGKEWNRYLINQ